MPMIHKSTQVADLLRDVNALLARQSETRVTVTFSDGKDMALFFRVKQVYGSPHSQQLHALPMDLDSAMQWLRGFYTAAGLLAEG